ncbi:MAG: hypothetical protein VYD86_05900, partial [Verrucomicrobiota bacterium]|nr:hypothetical protein [Verrucomicrobiota bacterium]
LGFKVTVRGEKIRLWRINAPQIRGANRKAGLASRDFLRELILGREVLLQTIRTSVASTAATSAKSS